jgi:uncharacterized protein YcgI (DUF1989 family)
VSEQLVGRVAIKSKQLRPGQGSALEVLKDQIVQISTVEGRQVSDFVAINPHDPAEILSTAITRSKNLSIMLQQGMHLYSNRRNSMMEIIEDSVGRHDILIAACDPVRYSEDFGLEGHANCREALAGSLAPYGVTYDAVPDPINWFMNIAILHRGELEPRESLADRNDFVLLRAEMDLVVAATACPQDQNAVNAFNPTDILVRVFK